MCALCSLGLLGHLAAHPKGSKLQGPEALLTLRPLKKPLEEPSKEPFRESFKEPSKEPFKEPLDKPSKSALNRNDVPFCLRARPNQHGTCSSFHAPGWHGTAGLLSFCCGLSGFGAGCCQQSFVDVGRVGWCDNSCDGLATFRVHGA